MQFFKGQRVWLIVYDGTGCLEVTPATVEHPAQNGDGRISVRYEFPHEGGTASVVTVRDVAHVYADQRHALTVAAERSRVMSNQHFQRSKELNAEACQLV